MRFDTCVDAGGAPLGRAPLIPSISPPREPTLTRDPSECASAERSQLRHVAVRASLMVEPGAWNGDDQGSAGVGASSPIGWRDQRDDMAGRDLHVEAGDAHVSSPILIPGAHGGGGELGSTSTVLAAAAGGTAVSPPHSPAHHTVGSAADDGEAAEWVPLARPADASAAGLPRRALAAAWGKTWRIFDATTVSGP